MSEFLTVIEQFFEAHSTGISYVLAGLGVCAFMRPKDEDP